MTNHISFQDGLKLLTEACETIEKAITSAGGSYNVQMAPKVVTATDEADLQKQLERAEMENAEVRYYSWLFRWKDMKSWLVLY